MSDASSMGRRGGRARAAVLSADQRHQIARQGAQRRWGNTSVDDVRDNPNLPIRVKVVGDVSLPVVGQAIVEDSEHGPHLLLEIDQIELGSHIGAAWVGMMTVQSEQEQRDFEAIKQVTGVYANKARLTRAMAAAVGGSVYSWNQQPMHLIERRAHAIIIGEDRIAADKLIQAIRAAAGET